MPRKKLTPDCFQPIGGALAALGCWLYIAGAAPAAPTSPVALFQCNGQITKEDALNFVRQNSHEQVFVLKLRAGKAYTVAMESKQFDTFLIIESLAGDVLASDDDGGGGLNSRAVFSPPADGYYRIIATSFTGNATGAYLLSVTQP